VNIVKVSGLGGTGVKVSGLGGTGSHVTDYSVVLTDASQRKQKEGMFVQVKVSKPPKYPFEHKETQQILSF